MKSHWLLAASLIASAAHAQTIPQVQGKTNTSPLINQTVTLEGVVIGDFQGDDKLSGFFIQDTNGDGDATTSDGIFVYQSTRARVGAVDVQNGDRVRVKGKVEEFARKERGETAADVTGPTQTQLRAMEIEVVEKNVIVSPTDVSLPLPADADFERYEGMLVRFPQKLIVTGQNEVMRYGSMLLAPERSFNPTNQKPITALDLKQLEATKARSRIVVDDGTTKQYPKPAPYLNAQKTLRTGAATTNLTGVLTFDFDKYRVHPTAEVIIEDLNPRDEKAPFVQGKLKVAGANVQNFWTTLQSTDNPEARGAASKPAFGRQTTKIVAELKALDADIVGLMELENNGPTAITALVDALNTAYGSPVYAFISDPATGTGTDLIKCGIIYKPAKVTPIGAPTSSTDTVFNRAPIAQTFRDLSSKGVFSVVVNHFKSKGSAPKTGDIDFGEGAWNLKRVEQSKALLTFIEALKKSSKDNDVLALGDFNAYIEEAPIQALRDGGLKHLNLRLPADDRYSYSFDGNFGSLDHAFATASLDSQVADIKEWHVNSDEPYFLVFSTVSVADFQPNAFRASDHDPVLLGLDLKADAG